MSFPTSADVLVNCEPANCMPSPESPQKRTVASSRVRTSLSSAAVVAMVGQKYPDASVAALRVVGWVGKRLFHAGVCAVALADARQHATGQVGSMCIVGQNSG